MALLFRLIKEKYVLKVGQLKSVNTCATIERCGDIVFAKTS